ncbi:MAG: WecB/TagA/CpsF family glycosyltransferase [Sedimentisphaeraceae bacterium JB056]
MAIPDKYTRIIRKESMPERTIRLIARIIFSSVIFCFAVLPVLVVLFFRKIFTGRKVFVSDVILGKNAEQIYVLKFNCTSKILSQLPLVLWVLAGKLRIVGLSKKGVDFPRTDGDEVLFSDKPGLFTLYYLRQSTKIVHKSQFEIELEYLENRGLKYDILLIIKTIPAFFYSTEGLSFSDKVNLLDVEFDNITMKSAVNLMKNTILNGKRRFICFVNPDCLNKIFTDREYFDILQRANNVFPDGIGINIACKMIRNPMRENINGTDMLPYLCELCSDNGFGIYFLGAKPSVAEKMSVLLKEKYPNLRVCGFADGYFDRSDNQGVIDGINSSGADILLVAFGVPMQEKWIDENLQALDVPVVMGVGGLFDFYSGNIKRAPVWLREIGGEWIYRILQEPKRMWKRYVIGNPVFLYRVLRWKMRKIR